MNFDLTDEQREIQRLARDFAQNEVAPVAEELDRDKRFPYEIVQKLGDLGLMGIPYPEEYGGGGADHLSYAFVTEEQKQKYMPDLTSGRKLWSFGLTEPEAGSDAGNVRTTAKRDNGDWVIDGAKQFITNAGTDISGGVTITARTGENEVSNTIVPKDTPGYTVEASYRKMG